MPSFLVPQNEDILREWIGKAEVTRRVVRVTASAPWAGFTPDLPPNLAATSGFQAMYGLVARPDPAGNGEVLMADAGYVPVDLPNLPLTTDNTPVGTSGYTTIHMLAQFNRTDSSGEVITKWDKTMLALVGGEDTTAGTTELWRVVPTTGVWEQVLWATAGAPPPAGHEPQASRAFLSDWAEFPAGMPGRTAYNGATAAISEPVFVWCNLKDRVMVYPVDDGVVGDTDDGVYETLTDRFGADFRAATVEHFGGRLYFGNTIESGTQHRQRIRRTELFTADPLETSPGAGAYDIRDFSGDLLRLEKLADLMVAYFEDGVAFIRTTDIATAPDRVQLLREKRGLLSTHSVTSVGNQEHFGIFDDGWFYLDPSGRWTEVGLVPTQEGVQLSKWKETFYRTIDLNQRQNTVINYDGRFVRIAFTPNGQTTNTELWIFDPRGNRVFRDIYPQNVVCWAEANAQIREAIPWTDQPGPVLGLQGTWDEQVGSWDDLAAKFGVKNLNHGTAEGFVMVHDYSNYTKYDVGAGQQDNPSFSIQGMLSSGGDPTSLKTILKLWVEQIESGTKYVTMIIGGESTTNRVTTNVYWTQIGSSPGDINTVFATYNFTAANFYYQLSGTSPARIRTIILDVATGEAEERIQK